MSQSKLPEGYTVERAYDAETCKTKGWDLFHKGSWCNRFDLKRDAIAAAHKAAQFS